MGKHLTRYGLVYVWGSVFMLVTIGTAFVTEFENMTPAQEAAMTRLQWAVAYASIIVQAGTTIMALLNQSLARAQNAPAGTAPASAPPTPAKPPTTPS